MSLLELRPDYAAHGPTAAPHVRNAAIVAAAEVVLVVWDGVSQGTLGAARAAARLGRRCEWLAAPAPGAGPVAGGLAPEGSPVKKAGPPRREAPTGKPL